MFRISRRSLIKSAAISSFPIPKILQGNIPADSNKKDNKPLFKFGLVADIQYADRDPVPEYNNYYRKSPEKLKLIVEKFNNENLTFAVQLGDFVDTKFKSYDTILPIWNQIQTRKIMVMGNHDYVDNEVSAATVHQKLGLKKTYYDFSYYGWRFIVLNSCDISTYANEVGSPKYETAVKTLESLKQKKARNALPWNSAIGKQQLSWLEEKLVKSRNEKEKVILFMHHPLIPGDLWNSDEVLTLIEKFDCVFAVISGHTHYSCYKKRNGIYHWGLPGMVTDQEQIDYAIAYVYKDRIVTQGFGCTYSLILKFLKLVISK